MKKKSQCFFDNNAFNGIILITSAVTAMILANIGTTTYDLYRTFLETPFNLKIGILEINKNVLLWINDALMVVFFLLVGLEVKRELIEGSLSSRHQVIFPIFATIGGMIVPAMIYLIFNFQDPIARDGWAIPAATDVAFALGVLTLLGRRVPAALKTFLMALAIIDDLGAIIIITLFYTNELSLLPLVITAIIIMILSILNFCNVRYISIYLLLGVILWISILKSGIHATISGVIIGFFLPLKEEGGKLPAKILEQSLHPWVNFLVLPLFAFANAGISLQELTVMNELTLSIPLGIIIALFVGKPVGISLFCWLALKLKLASLPYGTTSKQIMAVGVLCGIGFTMSIFIATLAFGTYAPGFIILAKLGIVIGSLLGAVFGYILLRIELPH